MTEPTANLLALVIEDDPESLQLLMNTLPRIVNETTIEWESCGTFERAKELLKIRRYDLVATDIYRDPIQKKDAAALDILREIRATRFCPILAISSGPKPDEMVTSAFLAFSDKTRPEDVNHALTGLLQSGIPSIARRLHDDLDRSAGSYLWEFLEKRWADLEGSGVAQLDVLERLIRRRASIQLSKLDPLSGTPAEMASVEGLEFYIQPPISGQEIRLGELLRARADRHFRVVLTPHCHLTIQPSADAPRADHVLTIKTAPATEIMNKHPCTAKGEGTILDQLRRRMQSPADLGSPKGRYWFLPGFLDIPDLYCDFLQLESIPYERLLKEFEAIAVLDTPFAEALQSCFTSFYSAVGLPSLKPERYRNLVGLGPQPVAPE